MFSSPKNPTKLFQFVDNQSSSMKSATEMKNEIGSNNAIQIFDAYFRFFNILAGCPYYFRLDSFNQIECVAPVIAVVSSFFIYAILCYNYDL